MIHQEMFSLFSLLTVAIGFFALLVIIPAINVAASTPKRRSRTGKPQGASQIELLEEELKLTQQKYLELQQKLQHTVSEKEALRQFGLRLHSELLQQRTELTDEFRSSTFEQLQTLLTNYPSIHKMVSVKPDLPAKNLITMFTPLDNLLKEWGYEPMGKPWDQVPYNPQIHQPDAADISEGELVYIRFVGYRHQDRILCPTKVSRTLPGGG